MTRSAAAAMDLTLPVRVASCGEATWWSCSVEPAHTSGTKRRGASVRSTHDSGHESEVTTIGMTVSQ